MPRSEVVSIATKAQIRHRQMNATLTVERDFWLKESEALHDLLENIFEQAQEHGRVELYQNGKKLKLVVAIEQVTRE